MSDSRSRFLRKLVNWCQTNRIRARIVIAALIAIPFILQVITWLGRAFDIGAVLSGLWTIILRLSWGVF